MHYQHTQKVPDKVMLAASLAGLALGLTPPGFITRLAVLGILGAAAYSFRSLTIEVDDRELRLQFGDGPIKKSFPLADLTSVKSIRTTPLQGWGIHWIGTGWLYNIYGLDAVELCFANGKRALIGTDEPDKLAAAVDARLIVVNP
jgi:hypothetical protein